MTDLSVIILVGNEELHIKRCLERLAPLAPRQVFFVESQTGDNTHALAIETAKSLGWQVVELNEGENPPLITHHSSLIACFHAWPGLYAKQFNWALDNLPITSTWVLRLDADEYLTEATITSLRSRLEVEVDNGGFPPEVCGLNIELKRRFCGGEIRHGTVGIRQARIFRFGKGRCEDRAMDEHIKVDGEVIDFDGAFYDDNLNDMDWWREKHRGYAKREAKDALAFARGEVHFKRSKEMYYRQPRYLRAFIYFEIRYFLKGGILDGYAGWMWNFWQGLWYRCLVDREIGRQS